MLAAPEISSKRNLCHKEFETLPKDVRFPPAITIVEIDVMLNQLVVEEVPAHLERLDPEKAPEVDDVKEEDFTTGHQQSIIDTHAELRSLHLTTTSKLLKLS